jgi:beta-lactamase class A
MGLRLAISLTIACAVALGASNITGTAAAGQAAGAPSCGLANTWGTVAKGATGTVAAAVRHVETGALVSFHGETPMLMQSVFKVPIALAVLGAVDRGALRLDASIRVGLADLSPGVSPLAERVRRDGAQIVTLGELLRLMVVESDNSAADLLLRQIGAPAGVARYLASQHLAGIDVSLSERQNAEVYFDLPFPASAADPLTAFSQAIDAEPAARRLEAAKAYSRDRRNTATADAFVDMLARVEQGALISPSSTAMLLDWMTASTSFPGRIKGQLPAGTRAAHKSGTSGTTDGITAATNDAGLVTLPDGSHLALAVFVKDSADESAARDDLIARMARAAYDCWAPRSVDRAALEAVIRGALADAGASGFVHVREVRTGDVLAHVGAPDLGADTAVAPLSVIKVFVAASWIEHGFGDLPVGCTGPVKRMLVEGMIASGCDSAGADMAVQLRRRIGAQAVLRDLRAFGITRVTLRPDASDTEWGETLTLGEHDVPVTPAAVSTFLRAVGQGSTAPLTATTSTRLVRALEGVVQDGTASSIRSALAGTGWRLGGKTGTGPGQCGEHCDGWFAGLASDGQGGRYVILSFIRGRGPGGGVAAKTTATVAAYLARSTSSPVGSTTVGSTTIAGR